MREPSVVHREVEKGAILYNTIQSCSLPGGVILEGKYQVLCTKAKCHFLMLNNNALGHLVQAEPKEM